MLLILNKLLRLFVLFTLLICVKAHSFDYDNLAIHGFLSQGYIKTTSNNYLGETTSGSFDFTEASLNLHYRPLNRVHFSTQMLHRNVGESETFVSFDYAFVGINLFTSENFEANYMYGRTKIPWGLFHDSRDAPFSHLGILLDQAMYNEHYRTGILSLDGSKIDLKLLTNIGEFKFEWSYPHDIPASNGGNIENPPDTPGVFESPYVEFDPIQAARLSYISPNNSISTAVSWIGSNRNYLEGYLPTYLATQKNNNAQHHWAFSINYQAFRWQLCYETFKSIYNIDLLLTYDAQIPDFSLNTKTIDKGYYLQASYQYSNNITIFSRFSKSSHNPSSSVQPQNYQKFIDYSSDITLGIDWYLKQALVLKSEVHHISGGYFINPLENANNDLKKNWNMLLLQIAYQF